MLNINGKVDENYRYKMPAIKSTTAGKGNGVYTIFQNLQDVGKYLNQPPIILLKYLSTFNGSMANDEKMTITGGYSTEELQKALQVYINRFVICPKCGVPETLPQLKKEGKKNITLELKCSSCGTVSCVGCTSKIETKTADLIIKYLDKNEWCVSNKGTMVKQDTKSNSSVESNEDQVESNEDEEDENEYNPFG